MRNNNAKHSFAMMAICTAAALLSTGCRSMPGRGLFGMRSAPSAEALAGSGPTTTYPVPPSHSATPAAINSIAGGTQRAASATDERTTAQVAGVEISPGYALPAGAPLTSTTSSTDRALGGPNFAAAQANGIYSGNNTAAAGYESTTGQPSGYTFGTKALTPKTTPTRQATTGLGSPTTGLGSPTSGSSFAASSPLTPPSTSLSDQSLNPSSTAMAPPSTTNYTKPPAIPSGGFTLPTDSPAMSAIEPPAPATSSLTPPTPAATTLPGAASAPSFSTASATAISAPPASTPSFESSGGDSGYMPGSTSSAAGYPTGEITPTTNGSFYR